MYEITHLIMLVAIHLICSYFPFHYRAFPFVRYCKILETSAGIPLKHRHIEKRIALFYGDVSVGGGGGGTNRDARRENH